MSNVIDKEKLKQARINNMMKWTDEDYRFYNYFFKAFLGEKEIPYWDEVQRLKQRKRDAQPDDAFLLKESHKRFLKFMEEVKAKYE